MDRDFIRNTSDFPEILSAAYECQDCLKMEPNQVWVASKADGSRVLVKAADSPDEKKQMQNEYMMLKTLEKEIGDKGFPRAEYFEELDGGRTLYIREYIEGSTVAQLVETCLKEPGLSREQSISITLDVLRELEYLHSLHPPLIHRDIKPQNVIVDEKGHCHLIDFGIARGFSEGELRDTHVIGTRLTAPPEQFGYRQTDQRSDIFSTGVLFRYCLTGEYSERIDETIPEDLRLIITRATQFDPDNRYQSVQEMIAALEKVSLGEGHKKWMHRSWRRLSAMAASLIVCLCALLVGLSYGIWKSTAEGSAESVFDAQGYYHFHEPLLEEAVRAALGKIDGPLTAEELASVSAVHIFGKQIYDSDDQIDFLGEFVWMKDGAMNAAGLWNENGGITSLDDVKVLTGLRELCLYRQSIEDLTPLKDTHISVLGLGFNPLTDLTPIYGNPNIHSLNISCIPMTDLTGIDSLTGLEMLNISGMQAVDLSPLENMGIHSINLFGVPLADYMVLSRMPELQSVTINRLDQGWVNTFEQLAHLQELTVTHANGIHIEALETLKGLTKLYYYTDEVLTVQDKVLDFPEMRWIDMKNLQIPSLQCVSGMTKLQTLLIYSSQVEDYSGLENLTDLSLICCSAEQAEQLRKRYPDRAWQYAY